MKQCKMADSQRVCCFCKRAVTDKNAVTTCTTCANVAYKERDNLRKGTWKISEDTFVRGEDKTINTCYEEFTKLVDKTYCNPNVSVLQVELKYVKELLKQKDATITQQNATITALLDVLRDRSLANASNKEALTKKSHTFDKAKVATLSRKKKDGRGFFKFTKENANVESFNAEKPTTSSFQISANDLAQKIDWPWYVEEAQLKKFEINDTAHATSKNDAEEKLSSAEASYLQKIIRNGLVKNENDLEIQRKDPSSPLYSVKSFEALNLRPNLLMGVYDMGFKAPSKIQEIALPSLLADPPKNLIAQSQSGTGKTAAFVLAMLSRINVELKYPQVLCLSPTYELAIQTGEMAAKMAKFCTEIELRFAVRGEELERGSKITEQIIIGTPSKVLDWGTKLRMFDLSKITVFVLDEADVMIDTQGHQDQCIRIHKCLNHKKCQMMIFSATYGQDVMDFAEVIVPDPIIMRLKREEKSLNNIKQYYVKCSGEQQKYNALTNIYGTIGIGQAIIFCHTRRTAAWLAEKMSKDGHAVALLSGELTVEQRISVLDRFRNGQERVLVTTNVLSRGIDFEQVTIVVNFDLPVDVHGKADCETYLHRIGRTGRFGKHGIAINLVDGPQSERICRAIELYFDCEIKLLNADDSDEIEKIGA